MSDSKALDHASSSSSSSSSSPPANRQHDRLSAAKANIKFLVDPKTGPQPQQLRTRAFLRSVRYLTIFLFWRLVRYAKYAAVGALTAAVASTAIGSVVSGAAFVVAPTGLLGGATVGIVWAVAKFGWRRVHAKPRKGSQHHDGDPRTDEREDAEQTLAKREARVEPW
ncbi:hypothetical protein Slin15195_G008630 [Septoria linicola]|uniref:Transmembrane protein n=1 Tax=Septoria linicola TaxID=215465 RepID=A0A9Q9AH44_9PEZI|nr:hypothetical protein Slin14017_G008640 [Septoria linicola]USW47544.1 hypothetical protein Slin15195_G008630 [Septoria linicola]